MPTTNAHAIPYSTAQDSPDGYADQQALAEAVDRELRAMGETTRTSSGASPGAGWDLDSFEAISKFGVVTARVAVIRTGPNIVSDSNGNIANQVMATVPAEWRPPFTVNTVAGDAIAFGEAFYEVNGQVTLRSWSGEVRQGRTIYVTATFVQP